MMLAEVMLAEMMLVEMMRNDAGSPKNPFSATECPFFNEAGLLSDTLQSNIVGRNNAGATSTEVRSGPGNEFAGNSTSLTCAARSFDMYTVTFFFTMTGVRLDLNL